MESDSQLPILRPACSSSEVRGPDKHALQGRESAPAFHHGQLKRAESSLQREESSEAQESVTADGQEGLQYNRAVRVLAQRAVAVDLR